MSFYFLSHGVEFFFVNIFLQTGLCTLCSDTIIISLKNWIKSSQFFNDDYYAYK
jgi:hypothetical protein